MTNWRIFIFKVSQDWQTWRAALQETRKRQGFWGSGGLSGEFPASFSPSGFPSVDNYSAQGDINYHQIRTFLRVKWDPISDFIRTTVLNKNLSHQTRSTVTPPHICMALCTEQLPFDPICSSPWTMREGSFPPNWWTEAKKLSDLPQTHQAVDKAMLNPSSSSEQYSSSTTLIHTRFGEPGMARGVTGSTWVSIDSRIRTTAEGRTALRSGRGVLASKALRQRDEFLKEPQKPSLEGL